MFMKKAVFYFVALSLLFPTVGFAEDSSTATESTVESSSIAESSQSTENELTKTADSSFSLTEDSRATETSSSTQTAYGDHLDSTLVVYQGDTVTADMLHDDASSHGAALRDLKLLEEPSTKTLGKNVVKVRFMVYPLEEGKGEKQAVTLDMSYLVIPEAPTYDVQFVSYDSDSKEVKGKVTALNGGTAAGVSIYGYSVPSRLGLTVTTIKELYPLIDPSRSVTTDAEGYFTLAYEDGFSFAAFTPQSGDYSHVYTLDDKAFAGAAATENSTSTSTTASSAEKKEEKKKGLFPNTGERKTIYYSIAGIAILLLITLFLFIKSKQEKKSK
ncbi:LPXTG-domain-containing protein cell wall anchor domain [Enterococcus termitis]|nr:LPXTG-domain-containing protein cell wall anchor domain [Enterococcus termitis]